MRKINRTQFEYTLTIIFVIGFCIAILYDYEIFPPFKLIKDDVFENQINTIFQVQASVTTLGIALVTVLSSFSKETIFGITISQYIVQIKPSIYKHQTCIFLQLFLIAISYSAVIQSWYNILCMCLLSSLILIGLMTSDVFEVFNGSQYIFNKIKKYYLGLLQNSAQKQEDIYTGVTKDIDLAQETNNFSRINKNIDFLIEVFIELKSISTVSTPLLLKSWEEHFVSICKKLYGIGRGDISFLVIDKTIKLLSKNAQYGENKAALKIWDETYNDFFMELRTIDSIVLTKNDTIECLHYVLYSNLFFENNLQKNNLSLSHFSSSIYRVLPKEKSDVIKEAALDRLLFFTTYRFRNDPNAEKVAYGELCNYAKTLIDNFEHNAVKKLLKEILDKVHWNVEEKKCIFTILIYLYYLGTKEELASDKIKQFANEILSNYKEIIIHFIFDSAMMGDVIERLFFEEISKRLEPWEYFQDGTAKFVIIDSVVKEFFLFYILSYEQNIECLTDKLKELVTGMEFYYFNTFAGANKERTLELYREFTIRYCYSDRFQDASMGTIEMLENALASIYKVAEINKSEELSPEIQTSVIEKLSNNIHQTIMDVVQVIDGNKPEKIITKLSKSKIHTYTNFLAQSAELEYAQKFALNVFVKDLAQIILGRISIQHVERNDPEMLDKFFKLLGDLKFAVNTIIGYRNWFFHKTRKEEFERFEKDLKKIRGDSLNDIVFVIVSKLLYIKVNRVTVNINSLNEEEIFSGEWEKANILQTADGNYSYRITNDIFLPFSKQELVDFIIKNKKIISISIEFEYGFNSEDKIGVGIIINDLSPENSTNSI